LLLLLLGGVSESCKASDRCNGNADSLASESRCLNWKSETVVSGMLFPFPAIHRCIAKPQHREHAAWRISSDDIILLASARVCDSNIRVHIFQYRSLHVNNSMCKHYLDYSYLQYCILTSRTAGHNKFPYPISVVSQSCMSCRIRRKPHATEAWFARGLSIHQSSLS
jgi:hypothetical protein